MSTGDPIRLPVKVEQLPNNPVHEWLFDVLDGMPPARQKRVLLRARELAIVPDDEVYSVMSSLGIEGE